MTVEIWQDSRSKIDINLIKQNNEDFVLSNRKHINYINNYLQRITNKNIIYKILEPWSWFWAWSYFLSKQNNNFNMTLLDYDDKLISDLKDVYFNNNQFSLICGDMYDMKFPDNYFDFIYNAWVLEHFKYNERVKILKEYFRTLKNGWYMFIIIPNHFNIIYKAFYLVANLLWRWKVAKEFWIFSLKKESNELWLEFIERKTFIENSIYWMLTLLVIKKK